MFYQYSKIKIVVEKKLRIHRIKHFLLVSLAIFLVCACTGNVTKNREQVASSSRSSCHIVEHALGKTCVPISPQRVVVLDILDNALALGVKPVGATTWDDGNFRTYLPEQTAGIAKVGQLAQPNLESILRLQPDLILGTYGGYSQETYERLSQIAPTVLVGNGKDINWKEWLKTYAEALGKTQEAEKLLSDYDDRIVAFREQMGDKLPKTQVSVVSFWETVRLYMNKSFSGQILNDLGLSRPPAQDKEKVNEDVSLEMIPQMDGDAIFLIMGDRTPKLAQFTSHPLWFQLQAVKQGKVYEVEGDAWIAGYSLVAANRILDDLFKYLVAESQK